MAAAVSHGPLTDRLSRNIQVTLPLDGLRRLALGDLDEGTLERLVGEGEPLLVERKRELPKDPGLGAAVASLANTLGGWLLLGVTDAGEVVGYTPPKGLDLQSHLGHVLSNQVDPLPPFVAAAVPYKGVTIGVVRVFESADTPHVVRNTGAVYVRVSSGKQPISDADLLIALARRGEEAKREAAARLASLSILREALTPESWAKFRGNLRAGELPPVEEFTLVVRAGPFTVTPQFNDWAVTRAAPEVTRKEALNVASDLGIDDAEPSLEVQSRGRGCITSWQGGFQARVDLRLALDSGGAIGARITRAILGGHFSAHALRGDFRPLVRAVHACLRRGEAYGRSAWEAMIYVPETIEAEGRRGPTPLQFFASSEVTVPADDEELDALVERWVREYYREAGAPHWEPARFAP